VYLRVSITDRCNLRCTYCLPETARFSGPATSADELEQLMGLIAAAVPIHKIRLTGGEPTTAPDLLRHVRASRWLTDTVGLTSNGVLLAGQLAELQEAGLNRLNISLDAADPAGFLRATRRDRFAAVLGSIRRARDLGFRPLKLNAVATVHTDAPALVALARAEGVHLRFIELMAIGVARATWQEQHLPATAIRERLAAAGLRLREQPERDDPTSRIWTIAGEDPERCSLGFITTVSQPFCGTCDRLRLTSQGRLHTCLFDEAGTDLLGPLRRDGAAAVLARIRHCVAHKAPPSAYQRHGPMAALGG
jgi:cyclic pyranopterin phosphate synthase